MHSCSVLVEGTLMISEGLPLSQPRVPRFYLTSLHQCRNLDLWPEEGWCWAVLNLLGCISDLSMLNNHLWGLGNIVLCLNRKVINNEESKSLGKPLSNLTMMWIFSLITTSVEFPTLTWSLSACHQFRILNPKCESCWWLIALIPNPVSIQVVVANPPTWDTTLNAQPISQLSTLITKFERTFITWSEGRLVWEDESAWMWTSECFRGSWMWVLD